MAVSVPFFPVESTKEIMMVLPGENEIYEIGKKIKTAAKEGGIDLNDPKHEYTLWNDRGRYFQYTGSYGGDSHAAWADAREPPGSLKLYSAKAPLHGFAVMLVDR
jgi:hypothetical protein